eukprot:CAMPEP_0168442060 /NCGR_PEP_ID=MMETSP0228-20121227/43812_1 /TAXON_ID=133427 /ORGANISM="Protoceratium reticulatum, Strain CCCM 535 (=CCMP 1889)" /LENGTH=78 /DNA_ID=CAMNT_0008456407 /DNA_START=1 /DNA_END=237 /DNA_ORIENTATION=-
MDAADVSDLLWSDEEVLPLHEPHVERGVLSAVARLVAQLAMLLALIRTAFATCRLMAAASSGDPGFGKKGVLELPLPA